MNFNRTAFPKNFKTDNVRRQGTGQDRGCSLSKQLDAQFLYDLVRELSWTASGTEGRPNEPNKDFVCMTDRHDDREKDR